MEKVFFVSLGCDKNSVDSEFMLGLLRDEGYEIVDDEYEATIAVINTCAFIKDAQKESIDTILEMGELKKTGKLKKIVVAGCLAQRYENEIKEQIPEVDVIIGTTATDKLVDAIKEQKDFVLDKNILSLPNTKRVCTNAGYYSYLKIAEGCDKHCSYCIIPSLRGGFRSVPMERLLEEARFLAEGGTKELILVAQEITVYGTDIYGKKALPELINKLSEIQGIEWIRLMYSYPEEINDELIAVIRDNPKVCHYLDIPIQHSSDSILKRMGRRTNHNDLVNIITKLRKEIPDIVLRTSLITGFPGETEEDHEDLKEFVKFARFQRLGVFTYSKEEGTPAATFQNQIPQRIKNVRKKEIMALQQKISKDFGESVKGKTLPVIIEGRVPEEGIVIGRSYMDAPSVDGYVFIKSENTYISGQIVNVEIISAKEYDLIGKIV